MGLKVDVDRDRMQDDVVHVRQHLQQVVVVQERQQGLVIDGYGNVEGALRVQHEDGHVEVGLDVDGADRVLRRMRILVWVQVFVPDHEFVLVVVY